MTADARDLDFCDGLFDNSYAANVFHWVPDEDVIEILREQYRTLKDGGQIDFLLPNPDTFKRGRYIPTSDRELPDYMFEKDTSFKWKPQKVTLADTIPLTYYPRPVEFYLQVMHDVGFHGGMVYRPTCELRRTETPLGPGTLQFAIQDGLNDPHVQWLSDKESQAIARSFAHLNRYKTPDHALFCGFVGWK